MSMSENLHYIPHVGNTVICFRGWGVGFIDKQSFFSSALHHYSSLKFPTPFSCCCFSDVGVPRGYLVLTRQYGKHLH